PLSGYDHLFFDKFHSTPRSTLFPYTTLFRSHVDVLREGRPDTLHFLAQPMRDIDFVRTDQRPDAKIDTLSLVVFCDHVGFFGLTDRKSTRLNSSHSQISYAVFCLKKKTARVK